MKKLALVLCFLSLFTVGCNIFGKSSEVKFEKQLKSSDPKVRIEAVKGLKKLATSEALRILMVNKNDKNFRVKSEIKKAMAYINGRTFLN